VVQALVHQGVLFWREALRTSRQIRTYVLRTLLALMLFGILMLIAASFSEFSQAEFTGRMGRSLFYLVHFGTLFSAWLLTPVFCIQGVQEEIETDVLPLLALTPLSGRSILWSKVGSRVAVLASVLITCAPIAAMTLSFGGVAPSEQFSSMYYLFLSTFLLFMVSAILSFASRRIALPMIAVFSFGVWSYACVPMLLILPNVSSARFEPAFDLALRAMPFVLHPDGASISSGVFGLAVILVAIRLFFVGAALMQQKIDQAADITAHSRWPSSSLGFIFTLASAVVSWIIGVIAVELVSSTFPSMTSTVIGSDWMMFGVVGLCFIAFFYFSSMAYLRFIFFTLGFLERFSLDALMRILRSNSKEQPRTRTFLLWKNPVFWRETFTGGNGASGRISILLAFFLFVGWLSAGLLIGLNQMFDSDVFFSLTIAAYALTFFSVSIAVTHSIVVERQADMLQCLQVSTIPKGWIVSGKVRAAMFRLTPLWVALGFVWYLLTQIERILGYASSYGSHTSAEGTMFVPAGGALSVLLVLWLIQRFLAHFCVFLGLLLRNPKTAWMVNLVFTILFWPGMVMGFGFFELLEDELSFLGLGRVFAFASTCFFPWMTEHDMSTATGHFGEIPIEGQNFVGAEFIVAVVIWLAATWCLKRLCMSRLQKGSRV